MNEARFDLKTALATWRGFHAQRRVFSPKDLDELEVHLRAHIKALQGEGQSAEAAFREAVRELGDLVEAEGEYEKVYWGKLKHQRGLIQELSWRCSMLKNYVVVAFRNLRRHPGYAFINLTGLTVGSACCLLILLYVRHELSYDRFHENLDRIYRLGVEAQNSGSTFDNALSSAPMGPALLDDYPEILAAVRFHPSNSDLLVGHADQQFYEDRFFYTDASVFRVFTFPLLRGNPATALQEPGSVVITERIAQKYFGDEEAVGRTLTVDNERTYTITGVMENVPSNSHLQFDFLASFSSLEAVFGERLESWTYNPFFTYVLVPQRHDVADLNTKLTPFIENHAGEQLASIGWQMEAFLQPLHEIRLYPLANEQQGDIRYVYALSAIAVLILLIACINFMNLSTARSATRAKEIGIRKVLGAQRGQLVGQFLGEPLLATVLAALMALLLVVLLLPAFGAISGKELVITRLEIPALALGLIGIVLVVGLVSGSYSAFFLTAFRPVEVLKARFMLKPGRATLRRGLVVFQFTVSIILLIGTLVVHSQLDYMRNKKLGFDEEQVVVVPVKDSLMLARQETIKAELLQHASITGVSFASDPPGRGAFGTVARRPDSPEHPPETKLLLVDPDFVETLGISVVAGRNFSAEIATDERFSVILNEMAVRSFGWSRPEDAVDQSLRYFGTGDEGGRVIGVVEDFNFQPLHFGMQPLMLVVRPDFYENVLVRLVPGDVEESIAHLQAVWTRLAPDWPFEFSFLNEELDALYRDEQRVGQLFGYFAGLAVLIACLGIFGLAAFTAQQRTKEIGVRKVLGASVIGVVGLLSKEFIRLVLIAIVVALPIGYLVMNRWLAEFAYRVELSVWTLVLAGGIALWVAMLTASYHAIKAALSDPVESLRYE